MERLRLSANNRYFEYADGRPFPWIADTVWTMPQRMKWDDADYFMQERKKQGFTVLQIVALDPERDLLMRSPAGDMALIDMDLTKPNENYFRYLDYLLDKAEEYGFYVLLLPVWGQLVVGDDWSGGVFDKYVTEENAFGFGEWIGHRYKDRNNIFWCLGGDRQPIHKGVDYRPVWKQMAEGLAQGVLGVHLSADQQDSRWQDLYITYHACHEMETGECSTFSYWDADTPWVSFTMLQSGHGTTVKNYQIVEKEYGRERVLPVWDGEPAYEAMPTSWPPGPDMTFHGSDIVRKRAYWSLFAGAFGYTYGHSNIWCMVSQREKNIISRTDWFEALHSEGSESVKILRDFMEATDICAACPAQSILPVENDGSELLSHVQASVARAGDRYYMYFPSKTSTRLALVPGTYNQYWFNPADGKCYDDDNQLADQPKQVMVTASGIEILPPGAQEQDWVLVMSKAADFTVKSKCYYETQAESDIKKVFEW